MYVYESILYNSPHVMVKGQSVAGVTSCLPPRGPRDQTQGVMLGSRHLCPMSHLAGPILIIIATSPSLFFIVLLSESTSLNTVV